MIVLIVLILILLFVKSFLLEDYYAKLKGAKNAKFIDSFSIYNFVKKILSNQIPPFPNNYEVYREYQKRINRINFTSGVCLIILILVVLYKIFLLEKFV